ncbi:hypothetical protein PMAYCL1PPCAC_05837, partial [Pristionchus mayeri]
QTRLEKLSYALSTLLQVLLFDEEDQQETMDSPPEEQVPSSSTTETVENRQAEGNHSNGSHKHDVIEIKEDIKMEEDEEIKMEEDDYDEFPMPSLEPNKDSDESQEDVEKAEEAIAGPSTQQPTNPQQASRTSSSARHKPSSNPLWIREHRKPGSPIECNYCEEHARPGNEMAAHMAKCHADLLLVFREKYSQEEEDIRKYRPARIKPFETLDEKSLKEMATLRQKYAEKARNKYSDRYLPKAPRPRRVQKRVFHADATASADPPEERERGRSPERRTEKKRANRPCSICSHPIAESKLRDNHMRLFHPVEWLNVAKCSEPACDYRHVIPSYMESHQQSNKAQHAALAKFEFPEGTRCPHCTMSIRTLDQMVAHWTKMHPYQFISKESILQCGCGYKFSRLSALAQHWIAAPCYPSVRLEVSWKTLEAVRQRKVI